MGKPGPPPASLLTGCCSGPGPPERTAVLIEVSATEGMDSEGVHRHTRGQFAVNARINFAHGGPRFTVAAFKLPLDFA